MSVWHDVRLAIRLLVKDRWFTTVAIVAYAIRMASATAICSVVDGTGASS